MQLTVEQQEVFDGVQSELRHGNLVQTIGGLAGTGKTVLTSALAKKLPGFSVCAFTGKAAHVLREKGVAGASTIHSLIYTPMEVWKILTETQPDGTTKQVRRLKTEFVLKEELPDVEGILVDEASMVSGRLYADLTSFGLPIVFVGDHGQLEPIGDDPGLMADPDCRLETIHRNANEIAHFAGHLRQGNWASSWQHMAGSGERVHFVSPTQVIDRMRTTDQAIVAFNATRVEINRKYRLEAMKRTGSLPEFADRLIVLRNTRAYRIFNGQQVTAEEVIDNRLIRIRTDDDRVLDVDYTTDCFNNPKPEINTNPDGPVPLDFAYAITAHKSQGSEWDSGVVMEQYCPKWDHKRWTYTAATRFRNRLYWTHSKWK